MLGIVAVVTALLWAAASLVDENDQLKRMEWGVQNLRKYVQEAQAFRGEHKGGIECYTDLATDFPAPDAKSKALNDYGVALKERAKSLHDVLLANEDLLNSGLSTSRTSEMLPWFRGRYSTVREQAKSLVAEATKELSDHSCR